MKSAQSEKCRRKRITSCPRRKQRHIEMARHAVRAYILEIRKYRCVAARGDERGLHRATVEGCERTFLPARSRRYAHAMPDISSLQQIPT